MFDVFIICSYLYRVRIKRPLSQFFSSQISKTLLLMLIALSGTARAALFWENAQLCPRNLVERNHTSFINAVRELRNELPIWRQFCVDLVEPVHVQTCQSVVSAIERTFDDAIFRESTSWGFSVQQQNMAESVFSQAKEVKLAFGHGLIDRLPVAAMVQATIITEQLGAVAETQASLAVELSGEANRIARSYPLPRAVSLTGSLASAAGAYALAVYANSSCLTYVVKCIAEIANAAFGAWGPVRPFPPGFGDGTEGQRGSPPGHSLIYGLLTPRAKSYALENPIDLYLDDLDPDMLELMRRENYGGVSYEWYEGYAHPIPALTLPETIILPDPFTLLPRVIARAGTPIYLGGIISDRTEILISDDAIRILGAHLDLAYEETDAQGTFSGLGYACAEAKREPYPSYQGCTVAMSATGSPEQIARGESASWYRLIKLTHPLVNMSTGEPIPEEMGSTWLWIRVHKKLEAPRDPCYEWNGKRWVWRYGCPL